MDSLPLVGSFTCDLDPFGFVSLRCGSLYLCGVDLVWGFLCLDLDLSIRESEKPGKLVNFRKNSAGYFVYVLSRLKIKLWCGIIHGRQGDDLSFQFFLSPGKPI